MKKLITEIRAELDKIEALEDAKQEKKLRGLACRILMTTFKGRSEEDKEEFLSELSDVLDNC